MERPSCATCWYFQANTEAPAMKAGLPWGECHYDSPKASRHFPNMLPGDFCGKHPKFVMWAMDQEWKEKQSCESASSEAPATTSSSTEQAT